MLRCQPLQLCLDGSNFARWYQRLRDTLEVNNLLYMIEEPLADRPDFPANEDDYDDWRELQDVYIRVEWLMVTRMTYDMRMQFCDSRANEIVVELKALFIAQVRIMKYSAWMILFQP